MTHCFPSEFWTLFCNFGSTEPSYCLILYFFLLYMLQVVSLPETPDLDSVGKSYPALICDTIVPQFNRAGQLNFFFSCFFFDVKMMWWQEYTYIHTFKFRLLTGSSVKLNLYKPYLEVLCRHRQPCLMEFFEFFG